MAKSFLNNIIGVVSNLPGFSTMQNASDELQLYKDDIMFGNIANNELKFINKDGGFSIISEDVMTNKDDLLFAATRAYWIASGKI